MPKIYKIGIVVEYTPDENNMLEWEDETDTPRNEDELIYKLRSEVEEIIWDATRRNELWHMIGVIEVVND